MKLHNFCSKQPPHVIRDRKAPRKYSGLCIDLLDEIAKRLKFDYEIFEEEDQTTFGYLNDDGELNGIVRKLIDGKTDIGLGAFYVTADREEVLDFTVSYYDVVGISIMMQLHRPSSNLFKFLSVLEQNVWLNILGAYVITR